MHAHACSAGHGEWAQACRAAHSSDYLARRLQPVRLQVSPLERWWRYLWRRKGDVYHLMFDMCRFLDGRLWPEQDKTDVQLFLQLMKHVTGEASAAACCMLAPSAALASWSVMIAIADDRRDRRGCRRCLLYHVVQLCCRIAQRACRRVGMHLFLQLMGCALGDDVCAPRASACYWLMFPCCWPLAQIPVLDTFKGQPLLTTHLCTGSHLGAVCGCSQKKLCLPANGCPCSCFPHDLVFSNQAHADPCRCPSQGLVL